MHIETIGISVVLKATIMEKISVDLYMGDRKKSLQINFHDCSKRNVMNHNFEKRS